MNIEDFSAALEQLGWKQTDFARRMDIATTTVWRWTSGRAEIPRWVPEYLGMALELHRLHQRFVAPLPRKAADDDEPSSLARDGLHEPAQRKDRDLAGSELFTSPGLRAPSD